MNTKKLWLMVAAVLAVACGDDGDGKGDDNKDPAPGDDESVEVPDALSAALEAARKSGRDACVAVDACFPDEAEADFCNYPVGDEIASIRREWPPGAADSCWLPLYEKNAQATLAYLTCIKTSAEAFEACLQSCPEDAELVACDEALLDADEVCFEDSTQHFTDADFARYDACELRLAPEPA